MASSINWTDGPSGGTPLSAANLNKLAVVADVGTSGTPTGDALRAAFVPKWKASTAYAAGEPVLNPSGQTVTANAAHTSGTTYNPANWTVVSGGGGGLSLLAPLEAVPFTAFGHSFVAGQNETVASRWPSRVASRLRTAAVTNNGVAGDVMAQTAQKVLANWTPGTRGLVTIQSILNDVQFFGTDTNGPKTTRESLRAALAFLTAGAVYGPTATCLGYGGTGWTAGPTTGIYGTSTTTANDYVDVAWNGDAVHLLTQFSAGTGQGTVVATRTGDGVQVGTWDLGGMATQLASHGGTTPGVLSLTGFGTGAHTARFQLTTGAGFTVNAVLVPNPNPPTVLLLKEGPILTYADQFLNNAAGGNAALANTYEPAVDTLATAFPTLVMTPTGGPAGWNAASMTGQDGQHPNQRGSATYTDAVITGLTSAAWREGLNWLQAPFADTPPTPAYSVGGGDTTAPSTPTGLTVGTVTTTTVPLTWTASTDNVAVTGYKVRRGGTVVGTPTTTSYTDTGLTAGTSYNYTVSAVDAAGNESTQTGTVTATTTGATPPMSDTFSATFDATKWPNSAGAVSNVSGRLRIVPTAAYPQAGSAANFDMTQYPVYVQIPTLAPVGNGTIHTKFFMSDSAYSKSFYFDIQGTSIFMFGTSLSGSQSVTYNATNHQYLRFRVSGGVLYFEASPDKATWTVLFSPAAPAWVTTTLLLAGLQAYFTGTEPTPGYAEFDNFNA